MNDCLVDLEGVIEAELKSVNDCSFDLEGVGVVCVEGLDDRELCMTLLIRPVLMEERLY